MIAYSLLFFFFFRLITEFVEAIYAFGLLSTSIPPEVVSILFFFTPLLLILWPGLVSRRLMLLTGGLVFLTGAVMAMLDTRGRMLVSGLGVGSFMVFLPGLLADKPGKKAKSDGVVLELSLSLGLALSILARASNFGVDPFFGPAGQPLAWLLAVVGIAFLIREIHATRDMPEGFEVNETQPSWLRETVFSLGIVSALTLLYAAFSSPNVLSRWTGENYPVTLALIVSSLGLFAVLLTGLIRRGEALPPRVVILWNSLFLACLLLTILPFQLNLPDDPGGYPFYEQPVSFWLRLPYYGMILLFPIILYDFALYAQALKTCRANPRRLGAAFGLAALFMLLAVLAQVFTTVYDYIPLVGPLFRDRFWLAFLPLGLAAALPGLLLYKERFTRQAELSFGMGTAVVLGGLATLIFSLLTRETPALPAPGADSLKVLTYNIQQGYDSQGQKGHLEQLALMQELDADIIGLQESDTNRISGGNSDLVRFFAGRLGMHAYYGPNVIAGTFGVALLSKYPIENSRTFYMYSTGEQTATIQAEIRAMGRTYNVFVTHLGNDGPLVQQENFLEATTGLENVIAMGDFNFRPDSLQYQLTTGKLDQAWKLKWPDQEEEHGQPFSRRIDHIFVSPGIPVLEARYLFEPASDHPALFVELEIQ